MPDAPLPAELDHVAVAVERWDDAFPRYLGDLGGVWISGGRAPGFAPGQMRFPHPERAMKVEVLEPNDVEHNDFLRRFLDASGPGPHHLTFKVPDLAGALDVVRDHGYDPIGVDLSSADWKESFIHPKQACGIVVQIAQAPGEMPTEVAVPAVEARVARPAVLAEVVLLRARPRARASTCSRVCSAAAGRARTRTTSSSTGPAAAASGWLRPRPGSEESDWLGSRPGRLGHLVFELDEPAAVPGADGRRRRRPRGARVGQPRRAAGAPSPLVTGPDRSF